MENPAGDSLQRRINMNLVFHISEDGSEIKLLSKRHKIEIDRRATRVGSLSLRHVISRMLIVQVLASQFPFLVNRNAELADYSGQSIV